MLKVYNTLTRKLEVFKPRKNNKINIFCCGPTVYDYSHLGHAKTYVQFDVIVKYLRYKGYKVFYLQNITDIDDKIIKKANEEKIDWKTIAGRYEKEYLEDIKALGVSSVNKYARATDYMPEIISQVKRLIKKGFAYKISDGWYFDLSKFKDYGKLAKRTTQENQDSVSRIDENPEKRNKGDFCLWKFSKPNEPSWKTDLIFGRPGWHIEDTAITEKELGQQYDMHGGGLDLIFPHHEAEIAQMESISSKKPMVKYWLHIGFLQTNKEKMSKSLGNFFTIRDILKKHNKNTIRFMFISSHYRKPIDFSEENLEQSKNSLQKLNEFMLKLNNYNSKSKDYKKLPSIIKKTKANFEKAMDNDFETSNALTAIFNFTKTINKLIAEEKISEKDSKKVRELMLEMDEVFCVLEEEKIEITKEVKNLIEKRKQARKNKDFKTADQLREKIKSLGFYVDDTKDGSVIKKL